MATFAIVQLATNYVPSLTTAALTFLGTLAGMLTTLSVMPHSSFIVGGVEAISPFVVPFLQLLHLPPFSLLGMLYAALLGVGGALLGRTFSAKHGGSIVDKLL